MIRNHLRATILLFSPVIRLNFFFIIEDQNTQIYGIHNLIFHFFNEFYFSQPSEPQYTKEIVGNMLIIKFIEQKYYTTKSSSAI